jgi:hypothetical protein
MMALTKLWDVDYHLICNASYHDLQSKTNTAFCGMRTENIPNDAFEVTPNIVSDPTKFEKKNDFGMVALEGGNHNNVKQYDSRRGHDIFGFEFYGRSPDKKLIMASRSGSLLSVDFATSKWMKHGSWSKSVTIDPTNATCIATHPCNNVIAVGTSKGEVVLSSISGTDRSHEVIFTSREYPGIRSLHWLDMYDMLAFHVNGIILWWNLEIFSSEMDLESCTVRKPSLRFILSMKRDGLKVGSPTAYYYDIK